jgi:hypothetical protein
MANAANISLSRSPLRLRHVGQTCAFALAITVAEVAAVLRP